MKRNIHWLVLGVIYITFFLWYSNLSGPLTSEEVEAYLSKSSGDSNNSELFREFLENDDGKAFYMVNYLDLNENPPNLPETGMDASAWDLLDYYYEFMFPNLFSRACHPIFSGAVVSDALDLLNIEEGRTWDHAVIVRYRSRKDMADIVTNSNFFERHAYKLGGLEKTIAVPVTPSLVADLRIIFLMLFLIIGLSIQVFRKS